jgi:hypothetical protein
MESQSQTPFYLDKGLYVAVLAMILPVLSAKLGIQLDAEKLAGIILSAMTFIVAHKVKSGQVLLAEIRARAVQAVTIRITEPVKEQR